MSEIDLHKGPIQMNHEHGSQWATCLPCGAQWNIDDNDFPERVTEGDGFCDTGDGDDDEDHI